MLTNLTGPLETIPLTSPPPGAILPLSECTRMSWFMMRVTAGHDRFSHGLRTLPQDPRESLTFFLDSDRRVSIFLDLLAYTRSLPVVKNINVMISVILHSSSSFGSPLPCSSLLWPPLVVCSAVMFVLGGGMV